MTTSNVAVATPNAPKFVLRGNTVDELAKAFAELISKTSPIEVVESKKGGGQYGKWELGGGDGLTLRNKELPLEAGIPLYLGMTVVYRKLTPAAEYEVAQANAITKQANTIDKLKAKLAALEGK